MTFDRIVKIILAFEAGYVNNPDDPGGETKYGISKRSYPNLDIPSLTREQAMQIYKKDFWDKMHLDSFPDQLRLAVFDCGVNQGPVTAIKLLQLVLNVKTDGVMGIRSFEALSNSDVKDTLSSYLLVRHRHYAANPKWENFGRGWSKRLLEISIYSLGES